MIELVAFDGDNTLWDFDAAMQTALQSTLEELWTIRPGPETASLTVDRMIEIRNRVAAELVGRVASLEVVRHAAFERTLEEVGIDDSALAARLNAMFFAVKDRNIAPFEDSVEVLEQLRDSYRLALVTNGNTDPASVGLGPYFDVVIHAAAVGLAKPHPAIFELLLTRSGCRAVASVYVGDSLTDDVAGAQAAGLRAVWLNRSGRLPNGGIQPDADIAGLDDLPPVLETWS